MPSNLKKIAKVLIVDDCMRVRQEIRATVEDLVGETFEAEDGQTAVEAYLRHKPDWVTMDLAMRPMDGLTAIKEIKSRDPSARIVVVTAQKADAFRIAAQMAGATAYVLKDDLLVIRDLFDPAAV